MHLTQVGLTVRLQMNTSLIARQFTRDAARHGKKAQNRLTNHSLPGSIVVATQRRRALELGDGVIARLGLVLVLWHGRTSVLPVWLG